MKSIGNGSVNDLAYNVINNDGFLFIVTKAMGVITSTHTHPLPSGNVSVSHPFADSTHNFFLRGLMQRRSQE